MRFTMVPCYKCQEENCEHKYSIGPIELRDNLGLYVDCPNGHQSVILVGSQKFELLYQMGLAALLDGYGREAVSSFAATLERFHEFCIKVFLVDRGVQWSAITETWKNVASQSERQLGAFYLLYLAQFNQAPSAEQKRVEFRNNVIHKGYIPRFKEAKEFAKYVYDYIITIGLTMRPALDNSIKKVCEEQMNDILRSIPPDYSKYPTNPPSLMGLLSPMSIFGKRTFDELWAEQKEDYISELENRIFDAENENDLDDDE